MRMTYERVPFDFGRAATVLQIPRRIVIHRQGNPGVEGENGLAWGKRTGSFTIHSYVDDGVCFDAIPPNRHAFHVLQASVAAEKGFMVDGPYGKRGDYESIGIESEDETPESADLAPGQAYGLSQATRITLLLRVADYLRQYPHLTPDDVYEHADFDPWTRAQDLGDALNLSDFRDDLRDLLAGRVPWRTVGRWATGARAKAEAKPKEASGVYTIQRGDTLSKIAGRFGVSLTDLVAWNGITNPHVIEVGVELRLTPPASPVKPSGVPQTHKPLTAEELIDVVMLAGYGAAGNGKLVAAKVEPTRDTAQGFEVHRLLVKRAA